MKKVDVVVAHPYKHHVYHLVNGIFESNKSVLFFTPFYNTGFGRLISLFPGKIGKKASGYYSKKIPNSIVHSSFFWKVKRLISFFYDADLFHKKYDKYIASLISSSQINPKIVLTLQDYMPLTVDAAKNKGCLIVSDQIINLTQRSVQRIIELSNLDGYKYNYYYDNSFNEDILRKADYIFSPSNYTSNSILDTINDSSKLIKIPYGADQCKFMGKKSFFSNNSHITITARCNSARKGAVLFLKSLENLSKKLPCDIKLKINVIGKFDSALEEFKSGLNICDNIAIHDDNYAHKDIPELLSASDFFIMPSLSEGMSLICIEAMLCELPLVITPYCGIDLFEDGQMGFICEAEIDSITETILKMIYNRHNWADWGKKCRRVALDNTWDMYESRIKSFFDGLI